MVSRPFLERVLQEEQWSTLAATLPRVDGALPLFRMLALQRWLDVSDEELIVETDDRASLRRFCGFDESQPIPSKAQLVAFREALAGTPEILQAFLRRYDAAPLISVVSPVYRAESIVDEFVRQVRAALEPITADFEIVLVEDGSGDGTWPRIAAACAEDRRVKGIKLSRNFGQHYAITAGLEHARGQHVVVMDCDLQDDPAFIAALYAKTGQGYDVVLTAQHERAQRLFKRLSARLFAHSLAWMDGGNAHDWLVGGYSMLSRHAVDSLLRMRDVHRHYLSLLRWLGLPTAHVPVVHRPRHSGKSSYTFTRLMRHAIDGWVSHSNRLLYLSVTLGFSFLLAAIALIAVIVIVYFTRGFAAGWPSLVVLILTCTGVLLMSSGVLGIYVGKIFDQVRGRPLYVVERTLNAPSRRGDYTESADDR
jgi:glycosyltransferase involved in cell wall biosynthesis